ncbi:MAG: DUF459 domain-containing protein [Pseudomonadota bacterium]
MRRPRPATAQAAASPQPDAVAKVENASVILVVGDFYAGALARGLDTAFAGDAAVRIVNRFNGNSGIVRDDFYDWSAELGGIVDEVKPSAVVFMAGANDRQPIRQDGETFEKLSPKWSEIYRSRVQKIASVAAGRRTPFFWVSTPPPRSGALSRDYLAFNAALDAQLAVSHGEYLDIWDKFTTDEGAFTSQGPDVNGQKRKLRTNDGLNFTKAGRLKLAFYVEQPLRALLEGRSNDVFAASSDKTLDDETSVSEEPVGPIVRIAPVSLDVVAIDIAPASSLELAGGPTEARKIERTASSEEIESSLATKADQKTSIPAGRVDKFDWPK